MKREKKKKLLQQHQNRKMVKIYIGGWKSTNESGTPCSVSKRGRADGDRLHGPRDDLISSLITALWFHKRAFIFGDQGAFCLKPTLNWFRIY